MKANALNFYIIPEIFKISFIYLVKKLKNHEIKFSTCQQIKTFSNKIQALQTFVVDYKKLSTKFVSKIARYDPTRKRQTFEVARKTQINSIKSCRT